MAFTASILADLPSVGDPQTTGYYYQYGDADISVFIALTNTDLTDKVIKQLYLTQDNTAWGTGAGLSIGDAAFRYIGSSLNTTNNTIPAGFGRTIENLIKPQVNAITWTEGFYEFQLIPFVQEVGAVGSIPYTTPVRFRIYRSLPVAYEITNEYLLWDRATNKRPPQNTGFDWQLGLLEVLATGERVKVPVERTTWTVSPNVFLSVFASSDGINTQSNPYDPFTQPQEYAEFAAGTLFTPSAGSIVIQPNTIEGTATVSVEVDGIAPAVASTEITVRNRVPVDLSYNQMSVPFRFKDLSLALFKIFLTWSDGKVEDVSISPLVTLILEPWVIPLAGQGTTTEGGIDYRLLFITNPSNTRFTFFSPLALPFQIVYNLPSVVRLTKNASLLVQKIP